MFSLILSQMWTKDDCVYHANISSLVLTHKAEANGDEMLKLRSLQQRYSKRESWWHAGFLTIRARLLFLSLWNPSQEVLQGRSMAAQRIIRRHKPAPGGNYLTLLSHSVYFRATMRETKKKKTHLLLTKEYMSNLSSMKRFHSGFSPWRSRYMSLETTMPSLS